MELSEELAKAGARHQFRKCRRPEATPAAAPAQWWQYAARAVAEQRRLEGLGTLGTWKMPSALRSGSAPSARTVPSGARAARMHLRAQPGRLGSLPWRQ